jgi:hypothetical protein
MVTALGTPKRHPKSGFYLFRKRVPEQLRESVGKREIKFSLRTRDPVRIDQYSRGGILNCTSCIGRCLEPDYAASAAGIRRCVPRREGTAGGVRRFCVRRYGDFDAGAVLPRCVECFFGRRPMKRRARSACRDMRNRSRAAVIDKSKGQRQPSTASASAALWRAASSFSTRPKRPSSTMEPGLCAGVASTLTPTGLPGRGSGSDAMLMFSPSSFGPRRTGS